MGFLKSLGNLVQAAIDVTLTPIDVLKDIGEYASGDEADNTAARLRKAKENLEDAYDELDDD